ncbi:MAG: hypothetical protein GX895_04665 [Clostridiales bacterium]|uniref:hypothetical protein n=1 Tax=Clostridium sp. N3C TaxID=1776758 RepID=UPI00092E0367|nr:hypothetical protein [Clostridium sp. N3C]NLZ48073.1 hypothetical protein [Clostridiales bacterium]SCN23253.1 hypothetical protein N3C_1210 [Clostridium sp. N3C]
MIIINNLLKEITECSEMAMEALKDILKLPQFKYNKDIIKYLCLIDDMCQEIPLILKVHYLECAEEEIKFRINSVYRYASGLIDIFYNLSRALAKANCNILPNKLKSAMTTIQEKFCLLAWEIVKIYGVKEAMSIVTPGYQVMSGIWMEYRRIMLALEA